MAAERENWVMCVACQQRVAELVAEDGRVLCSVCTLREMSEPSGSEADDDPSDG